MKIQPAIAALSLAFTSAAFAHPGHGVSEGHSVLHYFTEPLHVVVGIAVVVVAIIGLGFVFKRMESRKPATQKQENRSK